MIYMYMYISLSHSAVPLLLCCQTQINNSSYPSQLDREKTEVKVGCVLEGEVRVGGERERESERSKRDGAKKVEKKMLIFIHSFIHTLE